MTSYVRIFSIILLLSIILCNGQFARKEYLRTTIEQFFSLPRSNPQQKALPLFYIKEIFKKLGLITQLQTLKHYNGEIGYNVIGILPGRTYNTSNDNLTVVLTHYDSAASSPGVSMSGSGIAALIETMKTLSILRAICSFQYTLIFVACDFKENGLFGSSLFVDEWLLRYLEETKSHFNGALILDSLLNYEPFPTVQAVPEKFPKNFSPQYEQLGKHSYMGNYLQMIERNPDDNGLRNIISNAFDNSVNVSRDWSHEPPWLMNINIDKKLLKINLHKPYLDGNHRDFWLNRNTNLTLPAVHLSDTGKYRGMMQYCQHAYCDGLNMLSNDNLNFLATVTDTVIRTVLKMTQSDCWKIVWQCPVKFFQKCFMCAVLFVRIFDQDCNEPITN